MGARGELNVGQLARQRYGDDCLLVGFTTYDGTVTAASDWGERRRAQARATRARREPRGAPPRRRHPERSGSPTADAGAARRSREPRLERAIGVIYRPETERQSHYFDARLADQFDAVIHLDRTRALEPLERTALWDRGEPPETYPTGI